MHPSLFFKHLPPPCLLNEAADEPAWSSLSASSPAALVPTLDAWGLLTADRARMLQSGEVRLVQLGPYRLLDRLSAEEPAVLRARYTLQDQVVALKLVPVEALPYVAAAVTQLDHPNLVTVYDACEVEGKHFLVLEPVDGTSLAALIEEHGPLPVPLACEVIRQAALAVAHAHDKGMVHSNLTPGKLLLTGPHDLAAVRVKVVDFGLARPLWTRPVTVAPEPPATLDSFRGRPDYPSPERIQDRQRVDCRSDLYSLGCILYHALTGQVPFPGATVSDRLRARWHAEPEPVQTLRPEVPAALAVHINRLLARNPRDRFQTPDALVEALTPLCHSDGCSEPGGDATTTGADTLLATDEAEAAPALVGGGSATDVAKQPRSPQRPRATRKGRWLRWLGLAAVVVGLGAMLALVLSSGIGLRGLYRQALNEVLQRPMLYVPLGFAATLGSYLIYAMSRSVRT
jgi:hypothetical protein